MLDLDARVHLDEDVAPVLTDQELDGAGVLVADGAGEREAMRAQLLADGRIEVLCGRHLDDLLVAALDRTVAFEEVDGRAESVSEDLHLDVAWTVDRLLQEDGRVAEGRGGFAHRGGGLLVQLRRVVDTTEAASATAGGSLHEEREADCFRIAHEHVDIGPTRAGSKRRDTGGLGDLEGADLVAGQSQHRRRWSDEGDPRALTGFGEVGVLREKAVAGVDRVGAGVPRDVDDRLDVQVGADRVAPLADLIRLVRLLAVQ